jgi:VWFA-related protein
LPLVAILLTVPGTVAAAESSPDRLAELLAGAPPAPGLTIRLEIELLVDRSALAGSGRRARLVTRILLPPAGQPPPAAVSLEFGVRDASGRVRRGRQALGVATSLHALDLAVPEDVVAAAVVVTDGRGGRGEAACEPAVADLGPLPGSTEESPPARVDAAPPPVRLVPLADTVQVGRTEVTARVADPRITGLRFLLDGHAVAEAGPPSWTARVPFDLTARPQTLEAVAVDAAGREVARDAVPVNEPADEPWLRLLPVRAAGGGSLLAARVRPPKGRSLRSLELLAGERLLGVLSREPWEVPVSRSGLAAPFFHAVAVFDDGTLIEDVELVASAGFGSVVDVERVELLPRFVDANKRPVVVHAEDLALFEEGEERPVEEVVAGAELPLLLGIAVDASGSMRSVASRFRDEVGSLLDQLAPGRDRAFLVVFADNSVLAQAPTSDFRRLGRALGGLQGQGRTALWDAIAHALSQFDRKRSRRALVVLTDGDNTAGRLDEPRAIEIARRLGIPVFFVSPLDLSNGYRGGPTRQGLVRMAQQTGGALMPFSAPGELAGLLRQLFERLRAQTLVTFVPSGARPEKATWRRVEIRSKQPGIRVEGELGYFAGGD